MYIYGIVCCDFLTCMCTQLLKKFCHIYIQIIKPTVGNVHNYLNRLDSCKIFGQSTNYLPPDTSHFLQQSSYEIWLYPLVDIRMEILPILNRG